MSRTLELRSWALAGAAAAMIAGPAWAQEGAKRPFDIPGGAMSGALEVFGKQSHKAILFDRNQVRNLTAPATKGLLTPDEALNDLLAGSGLVVRRPNANTFVVASPGRAVGADSGPTDAGSPAASTGAGETGPVTVEELVVNASKRSETVKDTPTAISAITSHRIEALGIEDFQDYMLYVPGLQSASSGTVPDSTVIIRGLYTGAQTITPTIGFYLDETPFTAGSFGTITTPDPDLADVERVEVLKGPQGTLFGTSTLGGLIRVITKKPDLEQYSGDLRVDGAFVESGGDGYGVHGSASVPLIPGQLAIRISAFDRLDPGFVDNVQTGRDNVNSTRVGGGQAVIRYAPTDRLEIDITGFLQQLNSHGNPLEDVDATTLQPIEGKYKFSSFSNDTYQSHFDTINFTATYRLDAGTITNAASYGHYGIGIVDDLTAAYGPLLGFAPPDEVLESVGASLDKYTEELRFASNRVGRFEFLGGVFFTDEQEIENEVVSGNDGLTGALLPPPFDNLATAPDAHSRYTEEAVFGDVTFFLTDRLDATVGIRESHHTQTAQGVTETGLLVGGSNVVAPLNLSEDNTSYLFTLRWRPTDELSTYLRAASAFRPGGPQVSPVPGVPPSFGPDTVWNYEAGAKGVWFGGRLSADADIYYIKWSNIQLNALIDGFTATGNGGDAHSEGVEIEGQARLTSRLTLGANGSYDSTRIDTLSANTTAGAAVGDPLPLTPKWSGALTADYAFPVEAATVTLGASYRYHGADQSSFSGDATNTDTRIPAFSVVDLRARVDWRAYSLVFRVDNVANEYGFGAFGITRVFPGQMVAGAADLIAPRTYRLSLEAHF